MIHLSLVKKENSMFFLRIESFLFILYGLYSGVQFRNTKSKYEYVYALPKPEEECHNFYLPMTSSPEIFPVITWACRFSVFMCACHFSVSMYNHFWWPVKFVVSDLSISVLLIYTQLTCFTIFRLALWSKFDARPSASIPSLSANVI